MQRNHGDTTFWKQGARLAVVLWACHVSVVLGWFAAELPWLSDLCTGRA